MKKHFPGAPIRVLFLVAILLFSASPCLSQCQEPCAIHTLRPDALSVRLDIGDLFGGPWAESFEIIAEPLHGTYAGNQYSPGPDFWLAGVDRIQARGLTTSTVATVVLRAAEASDLSFLHEDFEINPIGALDLRWIDSHLLGTASFTPNALAGQRSLQVNLATGIPELPIEGGNDTASQLGIDIVLNNETPPEPWDQTSFETVLVNISGLAGISLKRDADLSEIKAWAGPSLGCAIPCSTPWMALNNLQTYHLTLSLGQQDLEDATGEWGLTLTTSAADGSWTAADQLLGLVAPIGGLDGPDGMFSGPPSGKVIIDDVTSWTSLLEASPGLRFEGFDGGSWDSTWSTQGGVTVAESGTAFGTAGAIFFSHPVAGSTTAWTDEGPSNAKKVAMHGRITLDQLTLPVDSAFQLFSGTNAGGANVFFVVLKVHTDGTIRAQARLRRPTGGFATSSWIVINDSTTDLQATWSANDDDSATVRLWAGGQYQEVEVAGAGLESIEAMTVGAKFLVLGEPTIRGGALLVDNLLLTY